MQMQFQLNFPFAYFMVLVYSALQSHDAVIAYYTNNQLVPFGFVERYIVTFVDGFIH